MSIADRQRMALSHGRSTMRSLMRAMRVCSIGFMSAIRANWITHTKCVPDWHARFLHLRTAPFFLDSQPERVDSRMAIFNPYQKLTSIAAMDAIKRDPIAAHLVRGIFRSFIPLNNARIVPDRKVKGQGNLSLDVRLQGRAIYKIYGIFGARSVRK